MLRQKLQEEQLQALKNKDISRLETLRFAISKIKNQEIEKKAELTDKEVIIVLQKIKKELQESLDAAVKGQRTDLISQNKKQLEIISSYLPDELTNEEIEKQIDLLIADNQELYGKNPKAIIGVVMKVLRGKADPTRIMSILSKKTS